MKKLLAIAAFLLASTAAQAQYSFEYGGRTIRIDPDRGTVSIPGVYDNTGRRTKRSHSDQDSDRRASRPRSRPRSIRKRPPRTRSRPIRRPPRRTRKARRQRPRRPSHRQILPRRPLPRPCNLRPVHPRPRFSRTPLPPPKPAAPEMVATTAPAPTPPASAVQAANSPLGVWLTEEKEGKVRIEQCGANLCGYSVDSKSNQNGEQVLINMKPGKDSKWSGRILDPNSGSTYDSTIALKGPDTLRVQGCAFGGMFCGGQTWSRVN